MSSAAVPQLAAMVGVIAEFKNFFDRTKIIRLDEGLERRHHLNTLQPKGCCINSHLLIAPSLSARQLANGQSSLPKDQRSTEKIHNEILHLARNNTKLHY